MNPHAFGDEGSKSAEGQAFVLLMQAGWSDWMAEGAPGNGAAGVKAAGSLAVFLTFGVAMSVLL